MAQQSINLGSQANDGTGDSIRDAFDKVNTNFTEVYTDLTLFNSVFSTGTAALSDAITTVYSVTATIANFSATQALFQQDLNDVANVLATKIELVTAFAGTGIGITNVDNTPPGVGFTINNLGVTSLTAGTRVVIDKSTGSVSISVPDVGVTAVNGSTGSVSVVSSITAGTAIGVNANTGSVTINNLGVQTLTAGTSTRISSSTGTVTIWAEVPSTPSLQAVTNINATTTNEITIASANSHGGATYTGLMTFTNATGGATNPNKFLRIDSTGTLEIVDSSYANTLFSLNDSGSMTIKGGIRVNSVTFSDNTVQTTAPVYPRVGAGSVSPGGTFTAYTGPTGNCLVQIHTHVHANFGDFGVGTVTMSINSSTVASQEARTIEYDSRTSGDSPSIAYVYTGTNNSSFDVTYIYSGPGTANTATYSYTGV